MFRILLAGAAPYLTQDKRLINICGLNPINYIMVYVLTEIPVATQMRYRVSTPLRSCVGHKYASRSVEALSNIARAHVWCPSRNMRLEWSHRRWHTGCSLRVTVGSGAETQQPSRRLLPCALAKQLHVLRGRSGGERTLRYVGGSLLL